MYDLLKGVRVLDVSLLAPAQAGMHLGDLGADVIKVELPPHGDHARVTGGPARAGWQWVAWNRNKRSLTLNLKTPEGRAVFLRLAERSDVVIDGLRAGTLESWGLAYEDVRRVNDRVVYCSLSGLGSSGPYRRLGSHGVAYDSMTGGAPIAHRANGQPYIGWHLTIGTKAAPFVAALAIAAALVKVQRTGAGSYVDIAEVDAALAFRQNELLSALSTDSPIADRSWEDRVRYQYYETSDGKHVIFQPMERKFWLRFAEAIGREDLKATDVGRPVDYANGNEALRAELTAIFKTRTQAEWIQFFIRENVPGAPVYTLAEAVNDPHIASRQPLIDQEHPLAGRLRMPTSPIKLPGQEFEARPAPPAGEHTREVLRDVLGMEPAEIDALSASGVISSSELVAAGQV